MADKKSKKFRSRPQRFIPGAKYQLETLIDLKSGDIIKGTLQQISISGLRCSFTGKAPSKGSRFEKINFVLENRTICSVGRGKICRIEKGSSKSEPGKCSLDLKFKHLEKEITKTLAPYLDEAAFITDELKKNPLDWLAAGEEFGDKSLRDFYRLDSPDIFEKCTKFYSAVQQLQKKNIFQSIYRITLTGPLDNRVVVFNPVTRCEEELLCFDSNSYLGLHLHPRVIEVVKHALNHFGYGTPSAQLLCGTNKHLRVLEETISRFHGREDTVIFPSGYSANLGTISALVRENDLVVRDLFSHTSIHDGCQQAQCSNSRTYPHNDIEYLDGMLRRFERKGKIQGILLVTDGVFSMHGKLADLPGLVKVARKYDAKLMVDEAHATGVIGIHGKGIEDHFNMENSVDVLMGTFSKAPGTIGGYVCGKKDLIYYLRFYANSAMFTASLPAAICAGVTEAFKIMEEEPEHRIKLWENVREFVPALQEAGFIVSDPESPIITIFMGTNKLLLNFSVALFQEHVKCGNVSYPAVPLNESILRFTLNARHSKEDLHTCIETLKAIGKKYDILHRSREEILEIGSRL
ncbi:aminotransferase class I/II-fold pyridoxal phosphate-dependent enzyme [Candidatus Riflebacteria bacterium]